MTFRSDDGGSNPSWEQLPPPPKEPGEEAGWFEGALAIITKPVGSPNEFKVVLLCKALQGSDDPFDYVSWTTDGILRHRVTGDEVEHIVTCYRSLPPMKCWLVHRERDLILHGSLQEMDLIVSLDLIPQKNLTLLTGGPGILEEDAPDPVEGNRLPLIV